MGCFASFFSGCDGCESPPSGEGDGEAVLVDAGLGTDGARAAIDSLYTFFSTGVRA